jgi:NAD(P)-dependent dehydrogenase (short-subunit alcohol dehydrogenase family)
MGLATVRALLDAGYRVAATDLRTEAVAAELAHHGDRLACFVMDVSDYAQVQSACDAIENHFGRIDVCVNNAGFLQYANCEQTTPELWHKTLRINLDGVFYVSQRVAPGMKARGFGRIVNMSSLRRKDRRPVAAARLCGQQGRRHFPDLQLRPRIRALRRDLQCAGPHLCENPDADRAGQRGAAGRVAAKDSCGTLLRTRRAGAQRAVFGPSP